MPQKSLSANTLFHFTDSFDKLESILKNEFYPHYCLEDWSHITADLGPKMKSEFYIPMVSFCDIPLSQIHYHTEHYGNYAIGLSKTWGINNQITPVFYIHENTKFAKPLADILLRLIHELITIPKLDIHALLGKSTPSQNDYLEILKESHEVSSKQIPLLQYIKPYQGKLQRYNRIIDNVRFYDEREWRHVPPIGLPFMPKGNNSVNMTSLLDFLNKMIQSSNRLSFEPKNIRYIIVESEDEVLPMKNKIEQIKSKFPYEHVQRLVTKIISMEQIREDF